MGPDRFRGWLSWADEPEHRDDAILLILTLAVILAGLVLFLLVACFVPGPAVPL